MVVIISERSCDPAHEFIIFTAKASREGFKPPHMWDFTSLIHTLLWKYIDKRTDLGGSLISTVIIWVDKYFFGNIIDERFILFGHKCVPSAKQCGLRRNNAFHQGLHCLLQVRKNDPQRKTCNLISNYKLWPPLYIMEHLQINASYRKEESIKCIHA